MFFKDIAGQEKIKNQLIDNVNKNRISHGYLFAEHEGSGALGMAFAYARYINCNDRGQNDSCGQCNACLKFNKIAHPDLHVFFPAAPGKDNDKSNSKLYINKFREAILDSHYMSLSKWYEHIGIEKKQAIINAQDCNEIIRLASIKTYESKYKIFILWMAEKLQYNAAPKLLKIIEEPYDYTIFIFITTDLHQIPETILSRLQLIRFPPLSRTEIKNALIEKCGCRKEAASNISFQASGSLTEALELFQLNQPEEIFYLFRDWLRSCYILKPAEIFAHTDKIASFGREKQKAFLEFGLKIFNQCLLMNYNAIEPVKNFDEVSDFLLKFSKFVNHKNIIAINESFDDAISHIERNANGKILFADLSFKMHKFFKLSYS